MNIYAGRQLGKTAMMRAWFECEMKAYSDWLALPGEKRWVP